MSEQIRPVDVAKLIGLGSWRTSGRPSDFDYKEAHARLDAIWCSDTISYELFQLLEWSLWIHKAANKAMAVLENTGLDDESEEEGAWYSLLCANEDTPEMLAKLLQATEQQS